MRQTSPPHYLEKQVRHGVHYIPRDKQPSMFEILSWKEKYDAAENNQWLVRLQQGNKEGRFTEEHKYERIDQANQERKKGIPKNNVQHQTKQGLYYYQDQQGKAKKYTEAKSPKKQIDKPKKEIRKLDQFDEKDKKQIELRKKNIQKFNAFTRELPNSAFTTYFGKPAFEHYGFGTNTKSVSNLKSHSVMPHAGKNHPQGIQSHEGALKKANVINLQSHVPKMKMDNGANQCKLNIKQYYNVQIVKPDLINQVRFANQDRDIKYRSKTPKHDQLNYLPKRDFKSPNTHKQKIKPKRKTHAIQNKGDKLSFMNNRENFITQLKQKQKVQNRLAYKVTQCHPYNWDDETDAFSTAKQQNWKKVRPAGVSSSRSLNAIQFRSL